MSRRLRSFTCSISRPCKHIDGNIYAHVGMDGISKKTHFLKLTFHIFQIPSSIFILLYFKHFPPKLLVFSSKSSPTRWCKKKPKPRQWAEWCAHWPRPTWLEGLPSPTNQTNWIPPTIRWVSPGTFQQTEEKTQKHPKIIFVSIFLRFSDDVFHWKKVTTKHVS